MGRSAGVRALVRASLGWAEWSNVSGVTWGGWLARTPALEQVSGRMYQKSHGDAGWRVRARARELGRERVAE